MSPTSVGNKSDNKNGSELRRKEVSYPMSSIHSQRTADAPMFGHVSSDAESVKTKPSHGYQQLHAVVLPGAKDSLLCSCTRDLQRKVTIP